MWPTFAFPALIVGMTLVVAPLLIHLINMLRHRRVKWAAMDFLLQSYKRNRNWVWLKQLLLLLLRMAVVAIAVLMLAGFGCNSEINRYLAGKVTHHFVLLDDSYSLADGAGGENVFERANKAIAEIAKQVGTKKGQRFTLIRFSQAQGRGGNKAAASLAQATDINGKTVDKQFPLLLEEVSRSFDVSQFAVGPEAAIDVAGKLMSEDERNVVYVVSDFRVKEWENPTEIRKKLEELHDRGAEIQLVSCVSEEHPNVAVLEVKPVDKTRAAGVPLPVDVKVKNYGRQPAKNVQVKVRALFYDPETQSTIPPEQMQPDVDDLPVVLIEEMAPGETVERRVQVYFPLEGEHVVEAYVEDENQKTDDRRFTVIDFPQGVPVLVIDGSAIEYHAYYLRSAFDPAVRDDDDDVRKRANTGIRPEVKNEAFLRDASPEELAKYHTIYLLDVGRLDDRAVSNLERFVSEGGGLGIFAGENVDTNFYNGRFFNNGEGLFPLPLEGFAGLEPQLLEQTADIEPSRHPLFSEFTGERYLMLRMVIIERYLKVRAGWKPEDGSGVSVAARLRNGDPLCVEKDFGKGRVAAFLTSVGPNGVDSNAAMWNNWTRTPAFPMIALELQSYLGMGRREVDPRAVGEPIDVQLEFDKYARDLEFVAPGDQPDQRVPIERTAEAVSPDSPLMHATLGDPKQPNNETDKSGVYEAWTLTNAGKVDVRRFAVNVDPLEGEMAIVSPARLEEKLKSVSPRVTEWNVILAAGDSDNNGPWAHIFLAVLIVLLLGEQLFAYLLSYHPLRGAVR